MKDFKKASGENGHNNDTVMIATQTDFPMFEGHDRIIKLKADSGSTCHVSNERHIFIGVTEENASVRVENNDFIK